MGEKVCKLCGESKPVEKFQLAASKDKPYRKAKCNTCVNAQNRERRAANPDKYRAKEKAYCDANREHVRELVRQSRQRHIEKRRAYDRERAKREDRRRAHNERGRSEAARIAKQTFRQNNLEHCREIGRKSRQRNIEKRRAYDRERNKRETRREAHRARARTEQAKMVARRYWQQHREHYLELNRQYRRANPERYRAYDRERNKSEKRMVYDRQRRKVVEKLNTRPFQKAEYNKRYRERNRDALLAYVKEWRERNRERCKALYRIAAGRRRARIANAPIIEPINRDAIIERDNSICYLCGDSLSATPELIHIDHVIPLSRDGSHAEFNMAVACGDCNLRKGTKLPGECEWARSRVALIIYPRQSSLPSVPSAFQT